MLCSIELPVPALDELRHGTVADDVIAGEVLLPDGLAVRRQFDGHEASLRMGCFPHGEDTALPGGDFPLSAFKFRFSCRQNMHYWSNIVRILGIF